MWDACRLLWSLLIGLFRSRASLEVENLALRQQIIVLRHTAPKRLRFNVLDQLIFVGLYRLLPDLRNALGEQRLRRVRRSYASYYNETRRHRSLNKDAHVLHWFDLIVLKISGNLRYG